MLGPECRHNGRHHCCDDCWLLGWCFGLWLHLGYDGQTTIDHDWMCALDYWFDHHLRSSKHSDVDRRAYHQWSLCGYPVRAGTCVHQRVRAAYQAWSSGWSSAVGYYMGNLDTVLVSCLKFLDGNDTANQKQRLVRRFFRRWIQPKCRQLQRVCLQNPVSPYQIVDKFGPSADSES